MKIFGIFFVGLQPEEAVPGYAAVYLAPYLKFAIVGPKLRFVVSIILYSETINYGLC